MSMRAVSRVADVSINTVTELLADVGAASSEYLDQAMRDLTMTNIQVDEICAFIGAKQKNALADADPTLGLGDCYTSTAIDRDTKLMPCYMLRFVMCSTLCGWTQNTGCIHRITSAPQISN